MTDREGRRIRRKHVAGLSRVIAATAVFAGLAACSVNSSGPPASSATSSPGGSAAPPTASPSLSDATSPAARLIPTSGAYLGAYVQPSTYTPAGEIAAVQSFQRTIGGTIDLVHTYHAWLSPFPDAADRYFVDSGKVLLLSWSGTPDTRQIIAGSYDAEIAARARAVKALGRPILLEFRHEMDRPNLQWAVHGPRNYIEAWDHIRAIFAKVGATNVGWVWCPTGWGFRNGRAQAFYPGNDQVDWVCADVYAATTRQPLQEAAAPFLRWARSTHKPILIGEFGAEGTPRALPSWLQGAGELARIDRQIRGMAYFDGNGTDSQGRPFQFWLGNSGRALESFHQLLTWGVFHPVLPPPK